MAKNTKPKVSAIEREALAKASKLYITDLGKSGFVDGYIAGAKRNKGNKPISKLADDTKTCKSIAKLLKMHLQQAWFDVDSILMLLHYTQKYGAPTAYELTIWDDGTMDLHNNHNDEAEPIGRCFKIVELLLSKGYVITKK
jgi:hypothetical protein